MTDLVADFIASVFAGFSPRVAAVTLRDARRQLAIAERQAALFRKVTAAADGLDPATLRREVLDHRADYEEHVLTIRLTAARLLSDFHMPAHHARLRAAAARMESALGDLVATAARAVGDAAMRSLREKAANGEGITTADFDELMRCYEAMPEVAR